MNLNENILDKLIAHFLGQERLKNGAVKRYTPIIRSVDKMLLNLFNGVYDGSKKQMAQYIARVKREKRKVYIKFEQELTKELKLLARAESTYVADLLATKLSEGLVNKPDTKEINKIAKQEIRGLTVSGIIAKLEQNDISNFIVSAKTSVTDGLSLIEARSRLKALNKTNRRHAGTIVHTIVAHITAEADRKVFKENDHLIKGIKLIVTFDNKTSSICIQHSANDKLYPVNNYPQPPFHMNCRTRAMPITKSFSELAGKTKSKIPEKTRVSMTGSVPDNFTYGDWLRRQSVSIQNDALGSTRANLFRERKFTIDKFIDPTGKYYTLTDLFKRG